MSKEDYFDKVVREHKDAIFAEARVGDAAHFVLLLKLFAKEVSRDTRHKAAEIAQPLHQQIFNMDMNK